MSDDDQRVRAADVQTQVALQRALQELRQNAPVPRTGKEAREQSQLERDLRDSIVLAAAKRREAEGEKLRKAPVTMLGLTEGRAIKPALSVAEMSNSWQVVERLVVTSEQLASRGPDGLGAIFAWEEEQRLLGRSVYFFDDVRLGRVVFEARERRS